MPQSFRQDIDTLKSHVDLVDLLAAHGVQAKSNGRGYKALCPWHCEKSPSLSVDREKGLYHCFGCGKEGHHLTFLLDFKELPFPEAIKELQRFAGQAPPALSNGKPQATEPPFPYELLERVAEVWHQTFCQRPEGLAYLESRGLQDKEMLRLFEVGYCDGEQLLASATAQDKEHLQRLGIINERGKEVFSRCVVFPLRDHAGRTVGFYGRSTVPKAKVPHRFCSGPKTGLFYPQAARGTERVHLVEGVLDALAFYQAGFPNVMAIDGTQGFNQPLLEHLKREQVGELVLCLDGDQAGQTAAAELSARLQAEGFSVRSIELPEGQDPLSLLPGLSQAELDARFRPKLPSRPDPVAAAPKPKVEPEAGPIEQKRKYRKLSAAQGKLKVLVSLSCDGQEAQATVDLFSKRSRKQEALELSRQLDLDPADLEAWFMKILNELQEQKEQDLGENHEEMFKVEPPPPMTAAEREQALRFLRRPDLVDAVLRDMERLGYMGDEEAKLLGWCTCWARATANGCFPSAKLP